MRRKLVTLLMALALLGWPVSAGAQGNGGQWEYLLMWANLADEAYQYVVSDLSGQGATITTLRESTRVVWDSLDELDEALLIDYLAVLGLAGYELVDVQMVGTNLMLFFKRPLIRG